MGSSSEPGDLARLTVKVLKERLKKLGIKPKGRKADLVVQLREAIKEKENAAQPETESEMGDMPERGLNPAEEEDEEEERRKSQRTPQSPLSLSQ